MKLNQYLSITLFGFVLLLSGCDGVTQHVGANVAAKPTPIAVPTVSSDERLRKSLAQQLESYKDAHLKKDVERIVSMSLPGLSDTDQNVKTMKELFENFGVDEIGFTSPKEFLPFTKGQGCLLEMTARATANEAAAKAFKQSFAGYIKGAAKVAMDMKASVICYTEDQGTTWYFVECDEEAKRNLLKLRPDILQKFQIASPTATTKLSVGPLRMEIDMCEKKGVLDVCL